MIKLTNRVDNTVIWQTTDDRSESVFASIPNGSYEIEISAAGYLTAQNQFEVIDALQAEEISIVLQRDPSAVRIDSTDPVVLPKVRKLTKHAIGLLRSDRISEAESNWIRLTPWRLQAPT